MICNTTNGLMHMFAFTLGWLPDHDLPSLTNARWGWFLVLFLALDETHKDGTGKEGLWV